MSETEEPVNYVMQLTERQVRVWKLENKALTDWLLRSGQDYEKVSGATGRIVARAELVLHT